MLSSELTSALVGVPGQVKWMRQVAQLYITFLTKDKQFDVESPKANTYTSREKLEILII